MAKAYVPKSKRAPSESGPPQSSAPEPLHLGEQELRELLENANDMIYTQDLEGNFTWVNQAALRITGYSFEEATKMNMAHIVAPEFYPVVKQIRADRQNGLPTPPYEIEIITKDGRHVPIEVSTRYIYKEGKPAGVQGTARDITDRKRSSEAMAQSEQRFRSLVQNSSDVITILNQDGTLRYSSPATKRIFGYDPGDRVGQPAVAQVHPDDREAAARLLESVMRTRDAIHVLEYRALHKDGSWRYVETTARNLLHDPSVAGIVLNTRDVTERRHSQEALQKSEQRLLLHAEQTLLGMIEFSPQGEIMEWNPAAENIFGYNRADVVGKSGDLIIPPAARQHVAGVWQRVLTQKSDVRSTHQSSTSKGRIITCEWSFTPLVDAAGQVVAVISLVHDVTEQRAAEEAVRRSEQRYRLLFERNLAGVYWSSLDGELVDCNESFAKMFGYSSRVDVMRHRALDLYQSAADREMFVNRIRNERTLTNVESLLRRKDGSPIWVLENVTLINDDSGAPMIQGTMIDITERKFAEQSLRQAEGRYRSIFENAAEGIFQIGLDGRWIIANPKLAHILGYDSAEQLTQSLDMKTNYYADPERRREFIRLMQAHGSISGFESLVYRKDGQTIWISESGRCVRNEYGHLVGFEGTVQDITERRRAEESLRQSERRLRLQNEVLVELSQLKTIERGDLSPALRAITEAAAYTLEVEYVSVWIFDAERTGLHCVDMFSQSTRSHQSGKEYRVLEYPAYFQALDEQRTIDADDAQVDSRTSELAPILAQQGITSVMDSGIRVGGNVVGVLSLEHTGPARGWTLDEKNFAGAIADLVSLAIEASGRKRAQDALRESESKFRAVAETAASAIYVHQGQRFLFTNKASESISGYNRDDLMAMDPFLLVHPEDRDFVRQRFEARFKGLPGQPERYEFRIVTKAGETRWLDFSAGMIQFEGQTALLGTAFDITERKRGEQLQSALYRIAEKTSTARGLEEFFFGIHSILSELIYARNIYIALHDPRSQLLSFPYHVDEHDVAPAPRKLLKGLTEYVLRTGEPYLDSPERERELAAHGEVELIGSPSVAWIGVPLKSGDSTFGVLALQSYTEQERFGERDIEILTFVSRSVATAIQRKKDEELLRKSEERYRSQVQSAVYGIYRSQNESRFLDVNPALVTMLGYERAEEVLALDMATQVYADPSERVRLLADHKPEQQIAGVEVQWKGKNNKLITVRLSGRALLNEQGEAESFEMLAEDVTERRMLEEQLRQSQKMEAVGRLAGGVAHDFNNLLTVIKGYSELMLDQIQPSDPMRAEVEEVKRAADRAAALTRQLLAFSRKQVLAPKVLDMNVVVTNMEKLLRRLLGEDVELVCNLDTALGRTKADPGQTEQVVMNLAVNARDAMPGGGRLIISTANITLEHSMPEGPSAGPYIRLDVADTGTGMDAQTCSRIFEPFFTTKEQGKGTGLGLSTVYGIVKQSGGFIDVQSEPGKGTIFSILLPRVDEAAAAAAPSTAPSTRRSGTETILLVEDEDGVRALARQLLQKQGYTVLDARHAGEALLVCERHSEPIHLLLTDVVLAQMSGRELAQRLLQLRPEMKVLFMSGYSGDAVAQHGIGELGEAFLQKPFNTESLITKVRETLDAPLAKAVEQ